MSTPIAKTQHPDTKLSPEQRMAKILAPRKKTGFDVCMQPTPSRLYAARGWLRTA